MLKFTSPTLPSPTSISTHTTSRSTSHSQTPAPATKITVHYDIGRSSLRLLILRKQRSHRQLMSPYSTQNNKHLAAIFGQNHTLLFLDDRDEGVH
ncbi:hypothetical protein PanWU01x14_281910 [Parasponia andersonii]|uniref:Uncharacterized protein n=1 Tax=Parasponia andersonii TaxID=3476 RepID=A0A2P5B0Y4_PARAD|nr:hypothetical protein PanWU01x14_281910 [Parasponia andersonii]